jgi:signal transduction histidine kinase
MLDPSGRHAGQLVHDPVDQLLQPGRLRWLLVLVPVAIVAGLELLSDTVLDEALPFPWDTLLVVAAVLVLGLAFAVVASRRIDALTGALRARNADLESRGASARALYRVSVAIAALSDIDEVLDAIVVHARDLLAADVAVLLLERPDGSTERRAAAGGPGTIVDAPAMRSRSANPADEILPFVAPGSAVVRLSAPLRRGGETIGLLAIGASTPRGFDADEVETLASLANQAAIALEHDRLETRLRELAVVEERERIARELHDGIAQVLGYVSTKSLAIDGYLMDGRVTEARAQATELGAAARAVYVDVREAILGLRSPIEPGLGLGGAVELHARRVAADSRFALDISVPPDVRNLRLDDETEGQVYRIVQEAMTNVRKHAAAQHVQVSMAMADSSLTIRIEDDGCGLAGGDAPADVPHYGLRSMRERAAAIGARLEVRDGASGGAVVTLDLPVAGHERPADPDRAPDAIPAAAAQRTS